ncbi:hypothetical protein chiPu_0018684 [Chiloscyllium punctatum]|uniref:Uncharacterized protein n=1 Tax=Chiloscyllium punctatum TaxID=137246 RepID=A0A401RPD8_CHIPU|nr:hypothetical protein [Chiloscyllium punctatum]
MGYGKGKGIAQGTVKIRETVSEGDQEHFFQVTMRFLWILHFVLGVYMVKAGDYTLETNVPDPLFPMVLNNTLMPENAAGLGILELSSVCEITVLTSSITIPSEQEAIRSLIQEDLNPVKNLLNGSSSILESLATAVKEETGKVSYQSLITTTVLDIKQQNELSNNIMTEIFQALDSEPTSNIHVKKFKEKVWKMDTMLQAIHLLASQVEELSDTLSTELSQHMGKSHTMDGQLSVSHDLVQVTAIHVGMITCAVQLALQEDHFNASDGSSFQGVNVYPGVLLVNLKGASKPAEPGTRSVTPGSLTLPQWMHRASFSTADSAMRESQRQSTP